MRVLAAPLCALPGCFDFVFGKTRRNRGLSQIFLGGVAWCSRIREKQGLQLVLIFCLVSFPFLSSGAHAGSWYVSPDSYYMSGSNFVGMVPAETCAQWQAYADATAPGVYTILYFPDWPSVGTGYCRAYIVKTGQLSSQYDIAQVCPKNTSNPPPPLGGLGKCIKSTCVAGEACSPPKNYGPPPVCALATRKPIFIGTGNKFLIEPDLSEGFLRYERYYNSGPSTMSFELGAVWLHTYSLALYPDVTDGRVTSFRNDGKQYLFTLQGGAWVSDVGISYSIEQVIDGAGAITGWRIVTPEHDAELYDATGKLRTITSRVGYARTLTYSDGTTGSNGGFVLDASGNPTTKVLPAGLMIRVSDTAGRELSFGYDALNRTVLVLDSGKQAHLYKYDAANNLSSVTYPDNKTKTYLYGEAAYTSGTSLPHALTGIIDENGVRAAIYSYDAIGRAVLEYSFGNVDKTALIYNTDTSGNPISTVVTDPLGTSRTYNFTTILGVVKSTGNTQPGGSGCGAASLSQTYDPNGNVATRTDFNGNTTTYIYDLSRNLETSRTEAVGRPEMRTITTTWHPTFRLPLTITEPGRVTTNVYDDASGNLLSRSIADTVTGKTRTVTYTYTTAADGTLANLLKSVDGPRTDVSDITTYTYYPNGDLQTVTNALSHVTNITQYDPNGRPETIIDPNTIVTSLTYWPRGWLKSRSVAGETTYYDYDGVGQIKKVTSPDGSSISYTYDDAHRLTDIYDAQGDYIHYTLDPIGNRIKEDVYNNLGTLVTTKSRVFDALNRLWKDIGALNQTTTYAYDANGNLTRIDGPLATQNEVTINSYDALNRLASSTDGLSGITRYGYDALDQLRSVTDPRSLTTSYTVNALGEQTQLTSPDTGTTNSSYDAAGNLISRTDADGKVLSYSYDALNRVTAIKYDGQPQYTFSYDQGPNALGKLTGMTGGSGSTTWSYNSQGRIQSKVQQTGSVSLTTSYSYYPTGQLSSITYPSGKIVAYGYNNLGQLSSIGVNGQPVISGASYQPFGPVASWTWGNNSPYARSFDSDGRLSSYPLGPLNTRSIGFDNASRIQNQTETSPFANTFFTYDALDRLLTWQPPNTNQSYYYDADGNRISLMLGGNSYTNAISPSSNRLQSVAGPSAKTYSYNNSGNRINDGTNSFSYDSAQRLTSVNFPGGSSNYSINALGQRILKTGSGGNTNFVYDEGGKLIGEYDSNGLPIEETLYLGDLPVAVLR